MLSIILRECHYHLVIFGQWTSVFLALINTSWPKLIFSFGLIVLFFVIVGWNFKLEFWLKKHHFRDQNTIHFTFFPFRTYFKSLFLFFIFSLVALFSGSTLGLIFFYSFKNIFLYYLTLIILGLLGLLLGSFVFHISLFLKIVYQKVYISKYMFFKLNLLALIFAQGFFMSCYFIFGTQLTEFYFIGWSIGHAIAILVVYKQLFR